MQKSLPPAEEEMKDRERKSSNPREVRNLKMKCVISYYAILCPFPVPRIVQISTKILLM